MNFIEILQQIRKGKCVTEAQERLLAVVKQCRNTGKTGEVTLKIRITPGVNGEMLVSGTSDQKLPKAEVVSSLFYDDENGALLREDPRQPEIPFSEPVMVNTAVNQ